MTTIPPQPPPPPPLPANAPRSLPVVTVANPPADLAKLAAGAAIEGTVTTEAGKTTVQLQTLYGTVQILTTLPLDKGARLTLVLQNLTQPLQLQIAAIDGKPPSVALRDAPLTATTTATGGGAVPTAGGPGQAIDGGPLVALRGLVGTSLTATLLRPITPFAPLIYEPSQTAAMSPPTAPGVGVPGPATPPLFPALATAGPASGPGPIAPGPLGPTAPFTAGLPPMTPGMQLAVRVIAVIPMPADPTAVPGAAPAVPAVPSAPLVGQTMTAVVTGTTAAGQPVLQTPAGTLTLATLSPLPRGAELVLEVRSEPLLAEPTAGPPLPPHPFALVQARAWPALAEAYQLLQSLDPAAAQQMAASTLPQANSRLTADMLFFLSALRGGDVGGWLSEGNMRLLRRERPELLNRLGDDFRQIGTMAREPVGGDWRIALVPFFTGTDLEQIRLYLRPYGGDEDESDGTPKGVRFIIDVDLTRLGRMQLDGLVRDDRKRVDLIVRSDERLPAAMQADIRAIFEEANALTGVVGGLTFQAAPAQFVDIVPTGKPDEGPGLLA